MKKNIMEIRGMLTQYLSKQELLYVSVVMLTVKEISTDYKLNLLNAESESYSSLYTFLRQFRLCLLY